MEDEEEGRSDEEGEQYVDEEDGQDEQGVKLGEGMKEEME